MGGKSVTQGTNHRRVQEQAERPNAFTKEKRQVFLDHLAGCCNVTRAAAAAGISATAVYKCRQRDPGFAAAFGEALDTGYAALEAMLLERAARGGRYEAGADAADAPGPETVDSELGLRLLALHARGTAPRKDKGGRPPTRVSEAELNEAILHKLALLGHRLDKKKRGK